MFNQSLQNIVFVNALSNMSLFKVLAEFDISVLCHRYILCTNFPNLFSIQVVALYTYIYIYIHFFNFGKFALQILQSLTYASVLSLMKTSEKMLNEMKKKKKRKEKKRTVI